MLEVDDITKRIAEHELFIEQHKMINYIVPKFNDVKLESTIKALIDFQSENKYLLMATHQRNQKLLGKLVANPPQINFNTIIEQYEVILIDSMICPLSRESMVNALTHMFGYFKNVLAKEEKRSFIELLEGYKEGDDQLIPLLQQLYKWSTIYQETYLLNQSLFKIFLSNKE